MSECEAWQSLEQSLAVLSNNIHSPNCTICTSSPTMSRLSPIPAAHSPSKRVRHSRSTSKTSTPSPPPLTSLQTYISNILYGVLIQDQDDIFELTFDRNWSRHVKETDNGTPLTFDAFRTLLTQTRAQISNRQLVSQSFVVAPADAEGRTGQVGHTTLFSGVQGGEEVSGTIVAVLKVGWDEREGEGEGRRVIETESFVMAMD